MSTIEMTLFLTNLKTEIQQNVTVIFALEIRLLLTLKCYIKTDIVMD